MKKKILFVDDDTNVLDGLRRKLRKMQNIWEMEFVDSAAGALEMLSGSKFELIISDYKMPGMDGIGLLTLVKEKYPHMIRIFLTGQSEKEVFEKSTELVHQYLDKPCDTEILKDVIDKLLSSGRKI